MICPQTKQECQRGRACLLVGCAITVEMHTHQFAEPAPKAPPPTLAEIERLVDAFYGAMWGAGYEFERDEVMKVRAALMAAIRAYGRE